MCDMSQVYSHGILICNSIYKFPFPFQGMVRRRSKLLFFGKKKKEIRLAFFGVSLFHTQVYSHSIIICNPHQKLLGDGLSTPITPFSLICTISSELSVILD